jgi:tRNA pseudouridine13 synthase
MSAETPYRRVCDLPHAHGGAPPLKGVLRARPEDFHVDEVLNLVPDGAGEHALLRIRKSGMNTDEVARLLGRFAGVHPKEVGYCGLKDRNAVTTQWFSLGMAGCPNPDWRALAGEGLRVLEVWRHGRKLRHGAASGNRFRIRVTGIQGDRGDAEATLNDLGARGVPNYFGEQRFGRDYGNLYQAEALFQRRLKRVKPFQRGLYLSAARSQIFNQVLARRVVRGDWDHALDGDLMQLDGSRAWFAAETVDREIERRVAELDIHPTGPLWGSGQSPAGGEPARLEREAAQGFPDWCEGLARFGLKQERRGLRMRVGELAWDWAGDTLELAFRLPSGCFATACLRELVTVRGREGVRP